MTVHGHVDAETIVVRHVAAGDLTKAHVADGVGVDGSVQVTKTRIRSQPVKIGRDDTDNLIEVGPALLVGEVGSDLVSGDLVSDLLGSSLLVAGDDRVVADDEGSDEDEDGDGRDESDGVRHDRLLDNVPAEMQDLDGNECLHTLAHTVDVYSN